LKRTKTSLRETLDALTATLVGSILAAARDSLLEMHAEPAAPPRKQRTPRRTAAPSRARTVDLEPAPYDDVASPASESPNELVITDPGALLAALETSDAEAEEHAAPPPKEPEVLQPVSAPKPMFVPAVRAGEEVMRASSSAVVLRRRRV
jgi:hypothetical protein